MLYEEVEEEEEFVLFTEETDILGCGWAKQDAGRPQLAISSPPLRKGLLEFPNACSTPTIHQNVGKKNWKITEFSLRLNI